MAQNDTFTGKTPAETYTKIIQITEDNELLDGVGAAVSPTITGNLNVNGAIYKDGVELGSSTDSYWSEDSSGDLTRGSNVDVDGNIVGGTDSDSLRHISLKRSGDVVGGMNTQDGVFNLFGSTTTTDQHLTIQSSGNVGVGTDNPEAKIEIESDSTEEDFFIVRKKIIDGLSSTTTKVFSINNEGVMTLGGNDTPPSVTNGVMYYNSTEDEFYLGYNE